MNSYLNILFDFLCYSQKTAVVVHFCRVQRDSVISDRLSNVHNVLRLVTTSSDLVWAVGHVTRRRPITGSVMPARCRINAEINMAHWQGTTGILLRANADIEKAYYIRLEPLHNRLVFDMWPRKSDQPYIPALERLVVFNDGQPVCIRVYVEDTICEVYVNDAIAMSTRLYDLPQGNWGVYAQNAVADFGNVTIAV